MKRAAFLDRDGVINKAFLVNGVPTPPRNLADIEFLPQVKDAILLIKEYNFEIVVVTNQPDVARGTQTQKAVQEINAFIGKELGLSHFYVCFHDDMDGCDCRKPLPGLLLKASRDLDLNLTRSFMVGDRWRDISAGQSAQCKCLFVNNGYKEKSPHLPFTEVSSLIDAAWIMIGEQNGCG